LRTARRLAVARQRLAGDRPEGILETVRDLRCLQLDPTSAVARSHLLVLWSRLGAYDPSDVDRLLWKERRLFQYWAHAASLVLTEDLPLHRLFMRKFATGGSAFAQRVRGWMAANDAFRRALLAELEERGPLRVRDFKVRAPVPWESTGWTAGRDVDRMLQFLFFRGDVLVAGRAGNEKLWDLAERVLSPDAPEEDLGEGEVVRRAAQLSLRALGVATRTEITRHFTRSRYPGLAGVLAQLKDEGRVVPVEVEGLPGERFVHADDLLLLDRIEAGDWDGRTTLLSPFDNLICDRDRTESLFGFRFRLEIYVPKAKREFGFFVMPVLDGDRLVGRVDPAFDRRSRTLTINALHWEPDARRTKALERRVRRAIEELGRFLSASEIVFASGPRRARAGP
jgi:uncharacterized protein